MRHTPIKRWIVREFQAAEEAEGFLNDLQRSERDLYEVKAAVKADGKILITACVQDWRD